jgi:hypothetical protein
VTDFYLHTAVAGLRWLSAGGPPIDLGEPAVGCVPPPLADQAAAVEWFDAEYACLLAARDLAVAEGWHSRAWQLARAMSSVRDPHVPVVHRAVPVPDALRLGV